ncbi:hypothetical protein IPM62_03330 [Candidatus Woesebacteria bacterium]|nr:MAG: hypothetical protein IPM62_03330 [Candidatus Woesebacteria bacterium]
MSSPTILNLNYTYKKPDTDVWVLNTEDIPIDKKLIKDMQIIHLAPKSIGGNHKHPRIEWFIGIGDLTFVWLDEKGEKYTEHMHPNGQIRLITVPPHIPHAVVNESQDKTAVLFEMADGKMKDVEQVKVV